MTADFARGRSAFRLTADVTLQEKARDTDIARRLGVSAAAASGKVWVYYRGDRDITGSLLVTAAHRGGSPIKQIYVEIQGKAGTGAWLALEEGF